ncbi:phytoene desaturase family protein [Aureibacter tunicatorum]|uniref:Phytoene desaturase n=1 Tax=Aureibacter tunicatorum TaxID=866807 RepID=A0AAE3XJZ6_9BACT|nr:phytoene desaturase family protein [Aureibacter tunicatorum]MDR6239181.1 phytoene desaturase [Aureibacter tunicatorum]BDD04893.1 phytoene dehydrogenase [Aureibacter tunicatorum]
MKAIVIGSGFSSLACSCYLAKEGYDVTVVEKNSEIGGRARVFSKEGFKFDIGPTWYWMPDVFEDFFGQFGKSPDDYYELIRLDPGYKVYFGVNDYADIPASLEEIYTLFETEEHGSSIFLEKFLNKAQENYDIAVKDLVYKPGESLTELVTFETVQRLGLFFKSIRTEVHGKIKSERLRKILEFPVLFLGAKPSNTPAFYNFMNFADFGLGTWHPKGGMGEVSKGIEALAVSLGVEFVLDCEVAQIQLDEQGEFQCIHTNKGQLTADVLISGADYHHTESLLPISSRQYDQKYWNKKTFAPSALLFFVGFDKKLSGLSHHTLFFDTDFDQHAKHIYDQPSWPKDPLFYASFPSITDSSFAPHGKESATFLIPLAPNLHDSEELRSEYFDLIISRLEKLTKQSLKENILFSKSYCVSDFKKDYNSFKGNAYGLANTLLQTAYFRPKIRSSKVPNLFFTGQLTVPGPGVPPSLISGKIASELVKKYYKISIHEETVV